jgi:hypothetical protein
LTATRVEVGATKVLAEGTGERMNAVLGRFDPTLLRNGTYRIELSATDGGGNTTVEGTTVEVTGRLKLGNFSLSFTDLQIPVGGIPITVNRVYDTLDAAREGDFGPG